MKQGKIYENVERYSVLRNAYDEEHIYGTCFEISTRYLTQKLGNLFKFDEC